MSSYNKWLNRLHNRRDEFCKERQCLLFVSVHLRKDTAPCKLRLLLAMDHLGCSDATGQDGFPCGEPCPECYIFPGGSLRNFQQNQTFSLLIFALWSLIKCKVNVLLNHICPLGKRRTDVLQCRRAPRRLCDQDKAIKVIGLSQSREVHKCFSKPDFR